MKYDPNLAPAPEEWLRLDETQRQTLVQAAHERDPQEKRRDPIHAMMQAAVETEIIKNPIFHAGTNFLLTQVKCRHEALDLLSDEFFAKFTGMMVHMAKDGLDFLNDAGTDRPGRKRKSAGETPAATAKKRAAKTPKATPEGTVYQLRVYLENMEEPFIWRRFQVPAHITLGQLHPVLQTVMGWQNNHLHAFEKDGVVWEDQDLAEHEYDSIEEHDAKLFDVLPRVRSRLTYFYDFGDEWRHNVVFEKRLTCVAAPDVPICLEGQGACPPEGCGGVWGYDDMLNILEDPEHKEHAEVAKWFSEDFDPLYFDIDTANERLGTLMTEKKQ